MSASRDITWALLDRDGTINEPAPSGGYICTPEEVRLLPDAAEAVRELNRHLRAVVVVTNQRGVSLGLMETADVARVNDEVARLLADAGAHIDRFYTCEHGLGQCGCRKPGTGLLRAASVDFRLPLSEAVMIGDSETDVAAGRAAGAATVRIGDEGASTDADLSVSGLLQAARLVLAALS